MSARPGAGLRDTPLPDVSRLPGLARGAGLVAAVGVGAGAGAVIALVAALRHDRPLHAVGRTYHARLEHLPAPRSAPAAADHEATPEATSDASGVPWIDDGRGLDGLVRFSRGAGLPRSLPDVQGLALRLDAPHGCTDLLLASSGLRGPARFALVPRRSPLAGPATTLMPFHAARGPVVLAAEPLVTDRTPWPPGDPDDAPAHRPDGAPAHDPLVGSRWRLLWSGAAGPWRPFAELTVGEDAGPAVDRGTRFDPVTSTPPGLPSYRWARLVRVPAYRLAQLLGRPRSPR